MLLVGLHLPAAAQTGVEACGNPFQSWFGPWDYRKAPRYALENVEKNHFTPQVEQLIRGVTTDAKGMGMDVAYVLGVFPNHHRALVTMVRLGERDKTDKPRKADKTIECWFDRASRFAPDDTVVRLLYANYLGKQGRKDDARGQIRVAEQHAQENALTHFNIGLSYFEIGDHDKALEAAHRAQALGLPRQELANLLKGVNKWVDPKP